MIELSDVMAVAAKHQYLAVVSTLRGDDTIQSSLVNAGLLDHPVSGMPVIGFVTYGPRKLANLRARPQITLTFTAGWEWACVEGVAELIGPDDPAPELASEALRLLLRQVFAAAGGTHDDWAAYDQVMLEQRRAVVLVSPIRSYSN